MYKFSFSWINTEEWHARVACRCTFNLLRNYQTLPFSFPSTSASSPTFSVIIPSHRGHSRGYTVLHHCGFFVCSSLMVNDVKHLSTCFFAIGISFLVKCLFKSFARFLNGVVSLYIGYKSFFCSEDNPFVR